MATAKRATHYTRSFANRHLRKTFFKAQGGKHFLPYMAAVEAARGDPEKARPGDAGWRTMRIRVETLGGLNLIADLMAERLGHPFSRSEVVALATTIAFDRLLALESFDDLDALAHLR